ncbi:hypothetical protein ALQ53_00555 [Pseudomonas cannabina]|uniref:Uncharacterized protein n=1 Tax=Pseudomonas cannabina TaxID=86840 RepID=A0A3M3Q2D2_PSECA|nr:hypothetical protein ALQ53_00555 [Pseudomonas cannabina]RMN96949.1 hypothetical protein ALQ51_04048 [Pseudomonas cannabina]
MIAQRVSTIVRRFAPFLRRRASRNSFPRWSVRNDNLNYDHYRATLRVDMPFGTLRVLFATQSVEDGIPTLE